MTPPAPPPPGTRRPAVAAVTLGLAGLGALLLSLLLALWVADHVGSTRLWRVESVVAPAVVALGAVAAGWVGASSLVAAACAALRTTGVAWRAGEAAVQRWAPGLVRRALAVAVAAAVGLGTAAGAHAAVEASPGGPAGVVVDLGWSPTTHGASPRHAASDGTPTTAEPTTLPAGHGPANQAVAPPAAAPVSAPIDTAPGPTDATVAPTGTAGAPVTAPPASAPITPPAPTGGTVEVRTGDTLWGLAARALGPDATDAAIAAEWPRWYAANASTIGPDPDVLEPGQVLTVPGPVDGSGR